MTEQRKHEKKVFLFMGDDSFEKTKVLSFWKSEFIKKHGEMNLAEFDLSDSRNEISEIFANLMSPPMFGEKRFIVIKGYPFTTIDKVDSKKQLFEENIENVLEQIPETSLCVFVTGIPDKRRKSHTFFVQHCDVKDFSSNSAEMRSKIQKRLSGIIEPRDVHASIELLNNAVSHPSLEIEKLELYARENGVLNKEEVLARVPQKPESDVFALLTAILAQDISAMSKLLQKLAMTEEPLKLLGLITWQLEQMILVKSASSEGLSDAEIIAKTKVKPFILHGLKRNLQAFSWRKISELVRQMLDLDIMTKTGGISLQEDGTFFEELEVRLSTILHSQS